MLAGGFRLVFLKPGKTGPVEHLVSLFRTFSEGVSLAKKRLGFASRVLQALPGFRFVRQSADLNEPATPLPGTGSAGAAGAGVSLPRATTCATGGATVGAAGGGAAAATACI